MAVGIATASRTKEEGRQIAFQNGKREIENFFAGISGSLPPILTQMTYEEPNKDGTSTVYRLLRVELKGIDKTSFQNQFTSRVGNVEGSTGSLKIMTVPPGADIYLGGDLLGRSNAEFSQVGTGSYELILKKVGYEPREISISVTPGKQTVVRETLPERTVALSIVGTTGAQASIKGFDPVTLPGTIPGLHFGRRYLVHVERPGYLPQDRWTEITDSLPKKITVDLEPLPARITVLTDPDGAVVSIGSNKFVAPIRSERIAPGTYDITVSKSGYASESLHVNLDASENKSLGLIELRPLSVEERRIQDEALARKQHLENTPWIITWGLGITGPPVRNVGVSSISLLSFGAEKKLGRVVGLRLGISPSNGIAEKASETGTPGATETYTAESNTFEVTVAVPLYIDGGIHLFPEAGFSATTLTRETRQFTLTGTRGDVIDTTESALSQPFFGGGLGYSYFDPGGQWGGYVRGGARKYFDARDAKGSTTFSIGVGLQARF